MTEKPAVVIYAAKSTEDTHGSIPTQLEDCRTMAERQGWAVVGEFCDEAFSAFHGNRGPDLEKAKALAVQTAREHGSCVLVAQDADRFARGAGDAPGAADHLGEIYFQMKRSGVELWTVRSGHLDLLRAAIEGERSTDESARKSQSVTAGLQRRKEKGKPVGAIPLGYLVDKTLVGAPREIDPLTAPVVERIYDMVERGATFGEVARSLNADGVVSRRGGPWVSRNVSRLVQNEAYAGRKGYPAIIAPERWEAIVDRLRRMDPSALKRRQGGRQGIDPSYFLRGLAFCGVCGASLYTRQQAAGRMYVCRNRREGTGTCKDTPPIPAALFEDHVLRHLSSFVGSVETWIEAQIKHRSDEHRSRRDALDGARASLALLDARRDKLMTAYTRLAEKDDPLAHLALEPVAKLDTEREIQRDRITEAEAELSEWAGPPDVDAVLDFYTDLVASIHGRIEQAAGVRELNQALGTVVAGLWAQIESDRDRLLVEFELLRPQEHVLPDGVAVMFKSRPTLPPRRLGDKVEPGLVDLGLSPRSIAV